MNKAGQNSSNSNYKWELYKKIVDHGRMIDRSIERLHHFHRYKIISVTDLNKLLHENNNDILPIRQMGKKMERYSVPTSDMVEYEKIMSTFSKKLKDIIERSKNMKSEMRKIDNLFIKLQRTIKDINILHKDLSMGYINRLVTSQQFRVWRDKYNIYVSPIVGEYHKIRDYKINIPKLEGYLNTLIDYKKKVEEFIMNVEKNGRKIEMDDAEGNSSYFENTSISYGPGTEMVQIRKYMDGIESIRSMIYGCPGAEDLDPKLVIAIKKISKIYDGVSIEKYLSSNWKLISRPKKIKLLKLSKNYLTKMKQFQRLAHMRMRDLLNTAKRIRENIKTIQVMIEEFNKGHKEGLYPSGTISDINSRYRKDIENIIKLMNIRNIENVWITHPEHLPDKLRVTQNFINFLQRLKREKQPPNNSEMGNNNNPKNSSKYCYIF
jgi:hypothetical protein